MITSYQIFCVFSLFGVLGILRLSSILGSKAGLKDLTRMASISWASLCFLVQGSGHIVAFQVMLYRLYFLSVVIQFTKYLLIMLFISRILRMDVQFDVIFLSCNQNHREIGITSLFHDISFSF
jgi:hypothetical protein